ncbi:MAG: hypothetical protein EOO01_03795 [Chitinophagaceae bacterium]|nr:MAG: hypothetical protein EOO01_03795 [Chitinophagaceae bacterium]
MKKIIKTSMLITAFTLTYFLGNAQQSDNPVPKWVSEKGYWIVEGNVKTPRNHTIRFYTNENILVYQESLTGIKLNVNKRKVKMKLKQVLESSVTAWETKKQQQQELALVKNIL